MFPLDVMLMVPYNSMEVVHWDFNFKISNCLSQQLGGLTIYDHPIFETSKICNFENKFLID